VRAIIRGTNRTLFFPFFLTRPSLKARASVGSFRQGAGRVALGTLYDCPWCGSAQSIEHGLCQVCLMEFPVETKVVALPTQRVVALDPQSTQQAVSGQP